MPIIWKTSFELPISKLIQSGKIGNSKQLVNYISQFYDASIKTGLPLAPGTPGGPMITGNKAAFKSILNLYFKKQALKQQVIAISIYYAAIKSIFSEIKEVNSDIIKLKRDESAILREQKNVKLQIQSLQKKSTLPNRELKNAKIRELELQYKYEEIALQISNKQLLLSDFILPKIQDIKSKLKQLTKRIVTPQLQDTKLKSYSKLPKMIKNLLTESKSLKNEYVGEIQKSVNKINTLIQKFKSIGSKLNPQDAIQIRNSINLILKTNDLVVITDNIYIILSILDSYNSSKISTDIKNELRNSLNLVYSYKSEILEKKTKITTELSEKFNEQKKQLINSFSLKSSAGPTKSQEIKADALEIKRVIDYLRGIIREQAVILAVLNALRSEYSALSSGNTKQYVPNTQIISLLNKQSTGLGDKYKNTATTPDEARIFIRENMESFLSQSSELRNKIQLVKTKYLVDIRKKILSKKINKKEIEFNYYLRLAIKAYWTKGTLMNMGFVTYPGVVTIPVSMKSTANPNNFIKSLSRTFQAHTLTVAGNYIIPGTPPVTLPWIGYK